MYGAREPDVAIYAREMATQMGRQRPSQRGLYAFGILQTINMMVIVCIMLRP